MKVGEQKQVSWLVQIDPAYEDRDLIYCVTASAEDVENKMISKTVHIPAYCANSPMESAFEDMFKVIRTVLNKMDDTRR